MPQILKGLPFKVHTNNELGMMLNGTKPLAMFADGEGCYPDVLMRYFRLFDRHVYAGRFIRRDYLSERATLAVPLLRVFFALPPEVWRIDAMIELHASSCWSYEHERREGELLGYEDWMNDQWIDRLREAENRD